MLKALIIDFDGTIIDSETLWYTIYREWTREHYGYDFPLELFVKNAGSDGKEIFEEMDRQIGEKVPWDQMQDWAYDQVNVRANVLPALPGSGALLKAAKEKGLKISLGTSSRAFRVSPQLERLGLLQYFDALSTADQSARVKPYPDIFLKGAELLGVQPEECLVIEDSANGLLAATRAGMRCLIVPNDITKYLSFEGAYQVLDSLEQVNLDAIIRDFE